MKELLNRIAAYEGTGTEPLIALVDTLRPRYAHHAGQARHNLLALCAELEQSPALRRGLRDYLLRVFGSRKQSHLYSDTGIFDGTSFFSELSQRLAWKVLPPAVNDSHLKDVFGEVFRRHDDWKWIDSIDDDLWLQLIRQLDFDSLDSSSLLRRPVHEILESLTTLSHRLTALGLDLQLVRVYPAIESYESPFLALSAEVSAYVREYHDFLEDNRSSHLDEKQALVLIAQCRDMLRKIRRRASETGVSIHLTQLMVRMTLIMQRMETLFCLLETSGSERYAIAARFFKELVRADNRKFSLREVFATHTALLALRVTDNAGRAGEHYVTATRRGYFDMLRSGLGAGFIISFLALLKLLASKLSLAPLGAAFVYSMNYSLGFMLIHMLHFTVATKQPAMTAARIAASIQEADSSRDKNLEALAELCVNVFRTQFIAILGNVALALPMAVLLGWAWYAQNDSHLVGPDKAALLLHELDPLRSLALFHAAIAGVCLFLAGLIAGYYDNKAVFNRIGERLRQRRGLHKLLGEQRLQRLTGYLEGNLGALAGNFYFGIMLGSMSTLGFILGLPLDIRHITFSSANFGFALVALEHRLPIQTWLLSLAGIAGIGLVNLGVSFGLALVVALRARGVDYRQWLPLAGMVGYRLLRNPLRFFWPPKDSPLRDQGDASEKKAA